MKNIKKISYYILWLLLFFSSFIVVHHYTHRISVIDQCSLTNSLEKREDDIWDLITTTTGITKEECTQLKNRQANECIKRVKRIAFLQKKVLSKKTISLIEELLKQNEIDPISISLLEYNNPESAVAASISSLYINGALLEHYDEDMKKYVIQHEISHLIHEDPAMQYALERLLEKDALASQIKTAFSRFCEERADIETFLCGIDFVKGGLTLLEQQANIYGKNTTSSTHPSFEERTLLAKKIGRIFYTTLT
jgi:hypothetical protein